MWIFQILLYWGFRFIVTPTHNSECGSRYRYHMLCYQAKIAFIEYLVLLYPVRPASIPNEILTLWYYGRKRVTLGLKSLIRKLERVKRLGKPTRIAYSSMISSRSASGTRLRQIYYRGLRRIFYTNVPRAQEEVLSSMNLLGKSKEFKFLATCFFTSFKPRCGHMEAQHSQTWFSEKPIVQNKEVVVLVFNIEWISLSL